MNYYDQHLHTLLSFDSNETFENYLAKKPAYFVATDHFDLHNPSTDFADDIPDYQKLKQIHRNLETPTTLLTGIEIGIVPGQEADIATYLLKHPYDLRLVSIHQNGQFDFMSDVVLTKDKTILIKEYYLQMKTVLENFSAGHILTHFDYGLRRLSITPAELAAIAEEQLIEIFKLIIQKEMAFELNAKSFGPYQNAALYRYAIPLYQSLGGKLFTLGSDAHKSADYELLFPEMKELLREFGVPQLTVFQGDERFLVDY